MGYIAAKFIVTVIGHFPVPVFGAGAGPVFGWYALLAVYALACGAPPVALGPEPRGGLSGV